MNSNLAKKPWITPSIEAATIQITESGKKAWAEGPAAGGGGSWDPKQNPAGSQGDPISGS